MNVTIIGGGNIGTLIAAELSRKNHRVTIYSSKPEKWNSKITVFGETSHDFIFESEIYKATNDIQIALKDAEFIWVTHPSFEFPYLNEIMKDYVKPGTIVAVAPGSGGAE